MPTSKHRGRTGSAPTIAGTDETDRLASLLEFLQPRIEAEKAQAQTTASREAIEFDAFAYIRREITLSRILVDLLDPRGKHAQGDRFLRRFLKHVGLSDLKIDSRTLVRPEFRTKEGRSIDIAIEGHRWIVGIENKPFARDSATQIADYLRDLRVRGMQRHGLIYLTKRGVRPHTRSIQESECDAAIRTGKLRLLSYDDINSWLADIVNVCEAPHVRWFLEALQNHIRRDLLGLLPTRIENMFEKALIEDASPEHLRTALELLLAKDSLRLLMVERFNRDFRSLMSDKWIEVEPLAIKKEHEMFYAWRDNPDFGFGVGFDEDDKFEWFYGIKFHPEISLRKRQPLIRAGARLAKRMKEESNEFWGLWRWFEGRSEHEPEEYASFEKSTRPWEDMCSGAMAKHFAALANQLQALFTAELRRSK